MFCAAHMLLSALETGQAAECGSRNRSRSFERKAHSDATAESRFRGQIRAMMARICRDGHGPDLARREADLDWFERFWSVCAIARGRVKKTARWRSAITILVCPAGVVAALAWGGTLLPGLTRSTAY